MYFTDEQMKKLRQFLDEETGLDEELSRRCGHLIHLGAFDEAVRSAFVLLEDRLRQSLGEEGSTGIQLINKAFSPKTGAFSTILGSNESEREGMRELFSGAFKLFRNPSAHGLVGFEANEGMSIIGLVDLLLGILKRVEDVPPLDILPENVQAILDEISNSVGPGASGRIRVFLGKCVKSGLKVTSSKQWIPFRRYAKIKFDQWEKPKRHIMAVFYLTGQGIPLKINFPINYYYSKVIGFNVERFIDELSDLGLNREGKNQEPVVDIRMQNNRAFLDSLFETIMRASNELEATLD
jgi:uncharacterized protein (TIGR02391 family)